MAPEPPLRPRLPRLLLVLAAGLGDAEAYCRCPVGAAACGVSDLVLVAGQHDTIAVSCVPDPATGHLEADIYVDGKAALASLDLSALASVGGYLWVSQNTALASLDVPALETVEGAR